MTPDDVRAPAARLTEFHPRFAPYIGKDEAQDHAHVYLQGLMTCPERKSIEPIALHFHGGRVSALQKFINGAPWDHDAIQTEIQAAFADDLVPTASAAVGVIGVVDASGFTKKGDQSAGVDRQSNGRLGKEDNCQVGVFLVGVTPGGSALLDHQLYLPESWCEDDEAGRERRAKAHIPETVSFQTKPQIAADLVRRTVVTDLAPLDGITADAVSGRDGDLLDEWEALGRAVCGRGPGDDHGVDRGPGDVRPHRQRPWAGAVAARAGIGAFGGRRDRGAGAQPVATVVYGPGG